MEVESSMVHSPQKPFSFRRRYERVDWRKLASVNLDQITRDLDFEALQSNLTNIAFCNVELELDLRLVDPNFVKLFRLAQLTIEYLLYSQDYLSETIVSLEGRIRSSAKDKENMRAKISSLEKDIAKMKKEGHKRKKLLMDQQQLIDAGADNFHKCLLCPKAFMNATFLQNHCVRRHGQTFEDIKSSHGDNKENSAPDLLVEQLQEIKERLVMTESQLTEERKSLREMSVKEGQAMAERDSEHRKLMTEWQALSESKHREEIDRIQNMLMTELREMQEKYLAAQSALDHYQRGSPLKPSNLGGSLQDDSDGAAEVTELRHNDSHDELLKQLDVLKAQVTEEQNKNSEMETRMKKIVKSDNRKSAAETEKAVKYKKDLENQTKVVSDLQSQLMAKDQKILELSAKKSVSDWPQGHYDDTKANGHGSTGKVEKREKTLTFADSTEKTAPVREAMKMNPNLPSSVPEIKEIPASDLSDSDDSSDNDETTLAEATSTAQTLSTLGTMDFTGRSKQLRDALIQNPRLMSDMKQNLQQLLNNELNRWGVSPEAGGMSSSKLAEKMKHLSQERQKQERKFKSFSEIRDKLIKEVEHKADGKNQRDGEPVYSMVKKRAAREGGATGDMTASSMTATAVSSTWGTNTNQSAEVDDLDSQLSSGVSSDEEELAPVPAAKLHSGAVRQPAPVTAPARPSQQYTRGNLAPSQLELRSSRSDDDDEEDSDERGLAPPRPKEPIKMPAIQRQDEGSDWDDEDDLSELQVIDHHKSYTAPVSQGGIRNIAASIESQLLGRQGKAPVGGVNTLQLPGGGSPSRRSPSTPEIPQMESDDDFSISSEDIEPAPRPQRNASHQWGSKQGVAASDKAASAGSDNASLTSVTVTAQRDGSNSDWSQDDDFANL